MKLIACAFVLSTTNAAVSRVGYDSNFRNAQLVQPANRAALLAWGARQTAIIIKDVIPAEP
jgi:hypothetical protein